MLNHIELYQKMVVLRLYFEKLMARTAFMDGKILDNGAINGNDGKRLTMVKTFAFISIALLVFSNITLSVDSLSNFLFIASNAVFIWAAYLIKKMAHSNTILISAVVIAICHILAIYIFVGEYNTLAIIFLLIYLEFTRRYYNELALLTSQWLFKLNIYIRAAWALDYIFNVIIFDTQTAILIECNRCIIYTSTAVLIIAWIQTQKIAKKTNV